MRDENQLHAAIVEIIAMDRAEVKYSTVQNWYPGDKDGNGGIYNFVTKRGMCKGESSKISWTQVETGSAITWKYPSCILAGDNSVGEFFPVAVTNTVGFWLAGAGMWFGTGPVVWHSNLWVWTILIYLLLRRRDSHGPWILMTVGALAPMIVLLPRLDWRQQLRTIFVSCHEDAMAECLRNDICATEKSWRSMNDLSNAPNHCEGIPPGAGKEPRRLSVSERKVAEQVAAGCTNAQAAAALFLSKRTVDTHLRNIYRRLGISNRSELTEFFKNNYREQE